MALSPLRRALLGCGLALVLALADRAHAGDVAIRLAWEYRNLPGPMKVYAVAPGKRAVLWETGGVAALDALPLGEDMTDRAIPVPTGGARRLILVYENPSDQPLYFFAAPHSAHPEESALGFRFKCLCVDHAYEVRPGTSWYRVVELRVEKDFSGDQLLISHTLIGIDAERKRKFSEPARTPDG